MRNSSLAILHTICQSLFGLLPLKLKKRLGDCTDFFFHFCAYFVEKKVQKHKRRQVLYVFNLIFSKWKLTEKSTRQPAPFEFGLNLFFLFFQCQGLRVIFVWQHSLFEFEGLFQLGVYNLIIVIQTLRNKAMNRGTFWKGVWVVFIVFFFTFKLRFSFAPVEKGRGRPMKGWTPPIGTPIVIPGLVRPAATPEIESVDASVSKPTAALCVAVCAFLYFFATFLWCSDSAEISLNFRYSSKAEMAGRHSRINLFRWGMWKNVRWAHSICNGFNLFPTPIPKGTLWNPTILHFHLSQKESN